MIPELVVFAALSVGAQAYDLPARERAIEIVGQMRLEEKIKLMGGKLGTYTGNIAGIERLGIPPLGMQDGPQGFRAMENRTGPLGSTTAWPSVLSVAAAWDAELAGRWGTAMGREFKGKGANVQLGPGIGLARVPVAGRNFEYLCGEDPFLGVRLVDPVVRGIQSQGVIANAKHFVNNEIEDMRQTVDAVVAERVQFELYYPVFQAAVDAGVLSVMCAYNRVNGVHACENPDTLRDLKETMGFNGWVMSDWFATHSTDGSLAAGLDQELPIGLHYSEPVLSARVQAGEINETSVDEAVTRVLTSMLTAGMFEPDYYDGSEGPDNVVSTPAHVALAREIGAKCTVLLKNDGLLPLSVTALPSAARIAVIGDDQTVSGTGSGYVTPSHVVTATEGIRAALAAAGREDVQVVFNDGGDIAAAVELAESADVVVAVPAVTSGESSDRETLSFGVQQDELLSALAQAPAVAAKGSLVVAAVAPGAVLMPWVGEVRGAVLVSWLPGQEAGNALADVLFGAVNPSGRLPVTFPNKDNEVGFSREQYPGTGLPREAIYSEALLVGYRWYEAAGVRPLFPFGHGLSYTTFAYAELALTPLVAGSVQVDLTVTNTGAREGAEVVQVYVRFPEAAGEPPSQLRHFAKTLLAPRESAPVRLTLSARDLSVWDVSTRVWRVVSGDYEVLVGASSSDIRLSGSVHL